MKRDDASALEQLLRRYEPKIRIVARGLLGRALRPYVDSVDLVQSVHRSLMMGIKEQKFYLTSSEQLIALAVTLVRRKIARQWRRMRRQNWLSGGRLEEAGFAAGSPGCGQRRP